MQAIVARMSTVLRLLYRLALQRLERGRDGGHEAAADGRRSTGGLRGPRRRLAAPLLLVFGACALAALAGAFLIPASSRNDNRPTAVVRMNIPATGASPLIVYLRGAGLEPDRAGAESPTVHRIESRNARFVPEFQAIPPASVLEMVNADTDAHNTHVFNGGETVFNVALPVRGVTVRKALPGYGMFRIRCDMHPWMKAWIFVSPSRHFAVVEKPATITFTDVEPGEYVLNVWQSDRPESALPLRLAAGEARSLRLR